MLIYNVTIKIDIEVAAEWLEWMQEVHIPEVLATGMFSNARMLRLLHLEDEDEGLTYAIQYTCANADDFDRYQQEFAPALQQDHAAATGIGMWLFGR